MNFSMFVIVKEGMRDGPSKPKPCGQLLVQPSSSGELVNNKAINKCMGLGMGGSCYYKLVRLQILSFFYQTFLLKINLSIKENKNNRDAH